ncbi:MAG: ABC transporter permease subunit [Proteobacteria bacterium]|nr:ABC transporter permease subunit [Pseudomonadota bacterium]
MLEPLSFGDQGWGDELLLGALMTLLVAIPTFLLGCVIGTAAATIRQRGHRIASAVVFVYTTFVRGIPELVVVYLIFFGGGQLLGSIAAQLGHPGSYHVGPFLAGLVSLSLISGAYATEVLRGAFKAVDHGQIEAAQAFGWPPASAFLRITAPQLLRIALPGLGNVWLLTLKDTALVSVTGLSELMRAASVATGSTGLPLYFYGAAMGIYLLLSAGSNSIFRALERYTRRGLRAVAAP